MEKEIEVGRVVDYFSEASVAAIVAEKEGIGIGDVLRVKGHTTDIILEVTSMQVDHEDVRQAEPGMTVGIKMNERVRTHDKVFKIISP
ncbi:translation elongation factor-like protein [candidate division KSB1 bacterium]|nr:translation elongation factor-like protein [candidate division KSB1 bacterium]